MDKILTGNLVAVGGKTSIDLFFGPIRLVGKRVPSASSFVLYLLYHKYFYCVSGRQCKFSLYLPSANEVAER